MVRRPPRSTLFPYTTALPICDQRIVVHGLHDAGIAREDLVLEMQDMRVRGEVAQSFEDGERKIGRGHLVRKTLADERSEEHTSELQSRFDLVCRLLLEKKKNL